MAQDDKELLAQVRAWKEMLAQVEPERPEGWEQMSLKERVKATVIAASEEHLLALGLTKQEIEELIEEGVYDVL